MRKAWLDRFLNHGCSEPFKGACHATLGGLSFLLVIYNAASYGRYAKNHSVLNVVVYSMLVLYEGAQTMRHLEKDTT